MPWFQNLLATLGLRERASAPKLMAHQVVGPLPLSLQLNRIGGGLTPQDVSMIIREADTGVMRRLIDLANEARQKDCHLQSVLGTREMALSGIGWKIAPPKYGKRKKDKKASDFATDALCSAENFHDLIADLVGADYYGYSTDEVLHAKDGAYVVPAKFTHISQRRFEFRDADGVLVWRDEGMVKGIDLLTEYPAGKFIQHQPRITGDIPCREGLVRVLMWASLFRNWSIRDWLQLGEIGWKPWRVGKYLKGASQEDLDALEEALAVLTASGTAVLPETTELLVEWPRSTGNSVSSTHKELCDFLGAEMSKAVLGQTLTTEQGQRGSQSLGTVHNNVRRDILEFDARSVASTIQRHLITPLIKRNFGDTVEVPEFSFDTQDTADLDTFSKAMVNLSPRMQIPVSWVRDQCAIPEPVGDEECLGSGEIDIPIDPETGLPAEPDPDDDTAEDKPEEDQEADAA